MRLRAPLGRPFELPLCPGLNGFKFLSFFSVPSVTDLPRVLAISPSEFMLCSQYKIAELSRGSITLFPHRAVQGGETPKMLAQDA